MSAGSAEQGKKDSVLRPKTSTPKKCSKVAEQLKLKSRVKKKASVETFADLEQHPLYQKLLDRLKEDNLNCGEILGTGSYSLVMKGHVISSVSGRPKPVAVKVICTQKKTDYIARFLGREMKIVAQLDHPNIVRFYSVKDYRDEPNLPFVVFVTEMATGGDLLKKIKNIQATTKAKGLTESDMKLTFRQLIEALHWMDQKNIVHRDIKCENIFLDTFENVKLGDFGFSRFILPNEKSNTFCGSRAYVAPEITLTHSYYGRPADVWSVGIVMFVSTTGYFPFDESHAEKMIQAQLAHKVHFPSRWGGSKQMKQAILHTLEPVPDKRPSYAEMMELDFFKDTPHIMRTDIDQAK